MISIEVCHIEGLDEQNLNIAKCMLKLRQVKAEPLSETWIRVNPNYVRILDQAHLICKNEDNKSFVQLTDKGLEINIFHDILELSLEEYFAHEEDIDLLIEDSFKIAVTKSSYKIMHNLCHCCGKTKHHLNHVIDNDQHDGMYCNQCLNSNGYSETQKIANEKRLEARNAFRIR